MKLTEEHKNVAINKIAQLWKGSKECEICGEEKWSLADNIFSITQFASTETEKQMYPVVVLTCSNCGNSKFFNAMSLGFSFNKNAKEES